MTILQPPTVVPLTIAINTAISGVLDTRYWSAGFVLIPSAWTAANLGFKFCDTSDGTFTIAKDEYGVPIQIASISTAESFWYQFPEPQIFAGHFVELWSKSATAAATTDVNQAAARSLTVILK